MSTVSGAHGVYAENSLLFERLLTLSSGVFAISLTLLVLNIEIPASTPPTEFAEALRSILPNLIAFGVTVFLVAIYWKNHHLLFESFRGIDAPLIGMNFVYIGLVALLPFPNSLISTFQGEPWAYAIFAIVLTGLSFIDLVMILYAKRRQLLRASISRELIRRELFRGVLTLLIFGLSIPLAFILVSWTPVVWVGLIFIDRIVVFVFDRV